jgi:Cys-rich repeat protein
LTISGFQAPIRNGAPAGEADGFIAPAAPPHIVLRTDFTNYAPGEVVIFTSSGWDPGETVTLLIREEPPIHPVRRILGHADSFGEFFDNQFIAHWHEQPVAYYVTAIGGRSGRNAITTFGNTSVNLDQCANGSAGTVACTGGAWQNGNLNSNQANYLEGQSIPYRDVFSGLSSGVTYTKTIAWDTTKSGKHAIDYLTSWDRNVVIPGSDPCSGVLSPCPAPTLSAIPADPNLSVANGFNGTQIAGSFQCYGCTISSLGVTPYSLSGSYSGDSSTSLTITFTATGPNAVIAWGGHVSTRTDWGAANSAVSISGSPYHMADIAFTCTPGHCSTGKQDRSVSAEAVVFPAKITVVKDTVPDSADDFSFTAGGGLSPSSFMLDDDGDPTLSNTRVFSGITNFKSYSVTEVDPAPFSLTAVACTDDMTQAAVGTADTGTRTATIPLAEGQAVTCKFTNTAPPQCSTNADCAATSATPVCDPDSGKCVECLASSDCPAGNPVCDTATHTCGDCTTDTQCQAFSATPVCNEGTGSCVQCDANSHTLCTGPTPLCDVDLNGGTCVACITSSDCTADNPVCDLATHTCGDCTTDAQCAAYSATPVCNEGAGSCVECDANSHTLCTGTKPLCDVDLNGGTCVACITSSDCTAAAPVCSSATHTCGDCTTDGDCSVYTDTPLCNAGTGSCVACNNNDDCSGAQGLCDVNRGGVCVACLANSDCPTGAPICDSEGSCSGCKSDTDCTSPSAPACSSIGTCVQCNGNEDCSGPTPFCDVAGGVCGECVTNSNCTADAPVCNLTEHTCSACTADTDCALFPGALACSSTGTCVQCNGNEDCSGSTPFCDVSGGVCGECLQNSDCPATAPVCDQSNHQCGGCSDDADCAGLPDTPACSTGGSCVECNSNDDCSLGAFCGSEGTCHTAPADGKIAPTATTCNQYLLGTAADLTQVLYGVKGNKISNVAPGVLFYYTYVSDLSAGTNTIRVDQMKHLTSGSPETPFFGVHQSQVSLYNASDCSTSNLRATIVTNSGQPVTINVSGATAGQDLIVGIKYNPSSVNGTTVGAIRPVVHYNFVTSLNSNTVQTDPDGLDLRPKP